MEPRIFWAVQSMDDVSDSDEWLSEQEQTILSRLRIPKRRSDWRLGRWTAKKLISEFLGIPSDFRSLANLEIRAASDGAPEAYLCGMSAPVSLSISHSSNTSLCAVGPADLSIGCDVERIADRYPSFASDYFGPEEVAMLDEVPPSERPLACTLVWSAKESALKALREGLRRDTRSVAVDLDPSSARGCWNPFTARCIETAGTFSGWWQAPHSFVLSIAANQQFSVCQTRLGDATS